MQGSSSGTVTWGKIFNSTLLIIFLISPDHFYLPRVRIMQSTLNCLENGTFFCMERIFFVHFDSLEEYFPHSSRFVWRSVKFVLTNGAEEYRGSKQLHSDLVFDHFEYHHVKEFNNSQLPTVNKCGPLNAILAWLSADNSLLIRSANVESEQLGYFWNDMVTRVRLERRKFSKDDIDLEEDSLKSLIRLQSEDVGRSSGDDNQYIVADLLMDGNWKVDLSVTNIFQEMGSLYERYFSLKPRAKICIVSRFATDIKTGGKLKRIRRK